MQGRKMSNDGKEVFFSRCDFQCIMMNIMNHYCDHDHEVIMKMMTMKM